MPFITSPSILSTKNSLGVIVVPVNRAIRFVGATVAPDGPAQTVVTVSAGTNTWNTNGNVLTGGGPTTPNEFFGSNNDFDVVMNRNSIEIARLAAAGFFVLGRVGVGATSLINLLVDPSVGPGVVAPIGSIGLRDNAGSGELWEKFGAADTDWALIYPANVTGTANTVAFFNALGAIASDADFRFAVATHSFGFVHLLTGGTFTVTGQGAFAHGVAAATATITASGDGAIARGFVSNAGGTIVASGQGSHASGSAASGGDIVASGIGAFVNAYATGTQAITVAGNGCSFFGRLGTTNVTVNGIGNFIAANAETGTLSIGAGATGCGIFGNINAGTLSIVAPGTVAGSFVFGAGDVSGTVTVSSASGAFARGFATGASSNVTASGIGAFASGRAASGGTVRATGQGAHACGECTGSTSLVSATGPGSNALGYVNGAASTLSATSAGATALGAILTGTGTINAGGSGSLTSGYVLGAGGTILAADGCFARGYVLGGTISATIDGATAFGFTGNTGALITAAAAGSLAFGRCSAGTATIRVTPATAVGAFAGGNCQSSGIITAGAQAAFAFGYCNTGIITASGIGSFALGYVETVNSIIASGTGAIAFGGIELAGNPNNISASGFSSLAFGNGNSTTSNYGATFGYNNNNSAYSCLVSGRYADVGAFNTVTWIATDPMFILGNGTGTGARANGYRIDKDGRQTTTASHVDTAMRVIAAAATISARTDYVLLCDSDGASGNLDLPAGENGLEFVFTGFGAGAEVYTLVANGGDVFDTNVVTAIAAGTISRIKFFSGTWYAV